MKLAKVRYNESYFLVFYTGFNKGLTEDKNLNDIQVVLEDANGIGLDSAICHYGSYGVEDNQWEIMSSSLEPEVGDSVKGHLTWKEVERYFDKTIEGRRLHNIVNEILNSENNNGFGVKVGAIIEASKKYNVSYKIILEEILKRGDSE